MVSIFIDADDTINGVLHHEKRTKSEQPDIELSVTTAQVYQSQQINNVPPLASEDYDSRSSLTLFESSITPEYIPNPGNESIESSLSTIQHDDLQSVTTYEFDTVGFVVGDESDSATNSDDDLSSVNFDEIGKLLNNGNSRLVPCISYPSLKMDIGSQDVTHGLDSNWCLQALIERAKTEADIRKQLTASEVLLFKCTSEQSCY
ncbi:unnamed protein product [Adineta steineri]|uniref:Uncharacterized protein n=1 Tax=Adineta steineri TaxID=433720 RepID=A0A815S2T3_9BILA|nr:unnamed protein product [Adineta steineri]CAF3917123.1 unnamed protein product [Adineta steineri]